MKIFESIACFTAAIALSVCWALLISCEPSSKKNVEKNVGADNYYFETATQVSTDLKVKVVLVQSEQEMIELAKQRGAKVIAGRELVAFAAIAPGTCTLYMLDPQFTTYQPEWIGHEFTHCVFGEWHKVQP
jgi:hypothetical protein